MDQASLAFFQSFYTNVSLYVVPEPGAAAPEPAPAPTVSAPVVQAAAPPVAVAPERATPAPAVASPPAPVPVPPAPVRPAPAPQPAPAAVPAPTVAAPGKLPSLANLNLQQPPVPRPPVAPAVAPAPPAVPVAPVVAAPPVDGPPARTAPPLSATPYSTLGSNPNGLVILVRMDAVRFQRLPRNVFLNNLLKAIRLVMEDVVLINVESHLPVELKTIRQKLAARQIIGFGKNLLDVAIRTTQLYEPVLLAGDAAYLPAAEIELLEEDNSRKKLLWQAMQRMFLS
ncbi:hypothetical protein E5K00_03510 [Hymenobacter aquaticus]|uniref:Uncharacterized protein n=1 Tax=Hymenobacter aquaticus TaxID=1867101 RepID=A0A4Z0Q3Y0_9BACT|nr:hypothetical protein [Hymenobacter aquaticus]TGE24294.1 hypothetical protein E5K00_03510 [Hymenobacter aquaticus]